MQLMHHILSVVASYLTQDRVRSHSLLNCRFLGEGGSDGRQLSTQEVQIPSVVHPGHTRK